MKCILTLLACSAIVPLCPAQRPAQVLPYPTTGSNAVTGNATQACVGQFTDDVIADGAILCGGNVFLLYAPERFSAYSKVTGPFTSIAKVGVSATGRDGLLASTSSGLVLLKWDTSSRQLTSTTALSNTSWGGATQLQTVVFGSTTKICAVSSTGATILFADWDGSQIVSSSVGSLDVSSTILSLAGLNWGGTDGTQHFDFAYDDGSKLRVVSSSGTQLYSYTNAYAAPIVLRMPVASGTDNVIWVTQNPFGAGQCLTVAHSSNGSIESPIYFGTMVAAHLTLADIDADGLQDLVVTRSDDHYARVLYRQLSGSMSYGLTGGSGGVSGMLYDLSSVDGSCSSNAPAVAAGDLDGDGDEDVLFAGHVGCGNQAYVCFANGVDDECGDYFYSENKHIKAWVSSVTYTDWTDGTSAQLQLTPWTTSIMTPVSAATDVHVTVWARATSDGAITPQSLADAFFASGDTAPTISIPWSDGDPPEYLVVCVNYVQRNGSGVVVHSYPSWVGQFDHKNPPLPPSAGGETTGGVERPPPPPSSPPPTP
jgi:hypothetical protein